MIAQAARALPPQMPAPPSYQKVNPGDQPVMFLVLRSATLPLSLINEYAETTIAQRISMVSGVAQVQVFGAAKYAVRVDVDPRKLAAHGIGIDEVASAIQNANVNLPTGTMYGAQQTFTVLANGQLLRAVGLRADDRRLPQRQPGPARAKSRTSTTASRTTRTPRGTSGERTIYLAIQKQPGTNVVAVVDAVKELLPTLPRAAAGRARRSTSATIAPMPIRESVHDVKFTLLLTVVLVVLVIFLFLRNISATIIPSLALPASIVATFAVMYLLGYSLDNLSLMALTLCGRLRRRRRDRDAREHRPPHGDGQAADAGGVRRLEGDRLHDSVDDGVARGGVHPGAVHGRRRRPAAARVRGHDRRRDSGVGLRVDQPDADAVQPVPEAAARRRGTGGSTTRPSGCSSAGCALYDWTLRVSAALPRGHDGACRSRCWSARCICSRWCPKGFLPSEDQGRFNISTEAMQGIGFDEMVRHQKQVADDRGDGSRTSPRSAATSAAGRAAAR